MPQQKKKTKLPKEHFEVLLEDINGKFDFVAEHISGHTTTLEKVVNKLDKIEEDVSVIKLDIEFIKHELKQKISRDEFSALEKRLSLLENKIRASL
jgi:chromosome segregation ATPase